MPSYYPENNTPNQGDSDNRLLQKIAGSLAAGGGGGGGGTIQGIVGGVPVPVLLNSLNFVNSTGNNSSGQLASGATYTGTIESILNQQAAQVEVVCDQPYTVIIEQFIDLAGTQKSSRDSDYTFTRLANVPLNENITLPGNYFRIKVTNTGGSTTTTFKTDVTFGIMATEPYSLSNLGNFKTAINEVSGAALSTTTVNGKNRLDVILAANHAVGAAANGYGDMMGGFDGTNFQYLPILLTTADGASDTSNRLRTTATSMYYNGTTWDRARGDATNGAYVQVKAPAQAAASGSITTQNLVPAGAATAGSAVSISLNGLSTLGVQVTGTYTGALSLQVTNDGVNWITVGGTPFSNVNTGLYLATITSALQSIFQCDVGGFAQARITGLSAMTGTAVVTLQAIAGAAMVSLDTSLPAGSAVIGSLAAFQSCNVAQINGTTPLMGSGINGSGAQRMTLVTDQAALTQAGLFSVKIDQTTVGTTNAFSIAQIGSTTVASGSGVNGAGVIRTTLATDQAACSVAGLFSVKIDQTTVGTTNAFSIAQIGNTTVVNGGVAGTLAIGGNVAHSAATTCNPVPTGGRVVPVTIATIDATLAAGDSSWTPVTTGYQGISKPFGTAELDWAANVSFTPTVWASAATLTQLRAASGTANIRTYVTGLQLQSDALGNALSAWILDGVVAVTSVTIATPGVFTNSGTNDFKVGDAVIFQSLGTITGISANTVYYVTSTSLATTTFTVALTPGGTALQITGSTAACSVYRVLHQVRLQTAALTPVSIPLPSPLRTAPNVQLSAISSSTQTGTVYLEAQGYYGF